MATETVNTIFQAKDNVTQVVKSIEKTVSSGFKSMNESAEKSNKTLNSINWKQTAQAAISVKNEVVALGKAFLEFANEGAKLKGIETTFKRLSGGTNIDTLQREMGGVVDKMTIMSAANKGLLLGLPVTSQSMREMAQVSRALGQAMGQDAATSLNDLITGFGRGSAMILDNLGIVIDANEAQKNYADSIGKTAEQLTSAEKKLAVFNAGMEAAKQKIALTGLETDSTKDSFDRASSAWTDFTNELKTRSAEMVKDAGVTSFFGNLLNTRFTQPLRDISFSGDKTNLKGQAADLEQLINVRRRLLEFDYKTSAEYNDLKVLEEELSRRTGAMVDVEKQLLEVRKQLLQQDTNATNAETNRLLAEQAQLQQDINRYKQEAGAIIVDLEAKRAQFLDKDRSGTRNSIGDPVLESPETIALKQQKVQLLDLENLKTIELANNGERLSTVSGRQFQVEQQAIAIQREYLTVLNERITMEQALGIAKQQQMQADLGSASAVAGQLRTLVGENTKAGRAIAAVQGILEAARAYAAFATGNYWGGAMHALSAATFFKVSGSGGGVNARGASGGGGAGAQAFNPLQAPQNTRQQPTIVIHTTWDQNGFNSTVDGRAVNAVSADINKGGQIMRTFQTASGRF